VTDPVLGPRGVPLIGQTNSIPMGVQLTGLETPKGIALESRRERFILAALAAIMTRESSTLASAPMLGRLAVNAADAALAAMDAPSASTANPEGILPSGAKG